MSSQRPASHELHVGGTTHLVRETMSGLERRLDPRAFLRIHRSRIVRLDLIADIEPLTSGQYVLRLKTGIRLTSGRSYRARLRGALGLDESPH
ncbi:MAG: LytTR family DNA-binding domain-containing protein [Vicinamibacteraceae bacterium]